MRFTKFGSCVGVFIVGMIAIGAVNADSDDRRDREQEYFSIDVSPLIDAFGAEHIVSDAAITKNAWYQMDSSPRVVVPSGSEAYLLTPKTMGDDFAGAKIVGQKQKGKSLAGHFYVLRIDANSSQELVLARIPFDVDAELKIPADRRDFLLAKGQHFQKLWSEELAGAAMFRHLARSSLQEIGESAVSTGPNWPMRGRNNVDDSIRLMSGGRAVSENLQLDRQLATSSDQGQWKSLSEVRGITVREIDWKSRLQDKETPLDPLASSIPHDQYAVFMPSFDALAKIVEQGNQLAKPAVHWLEPQSRETDVLKFYQQQLGLPLNALTRQVGGVLINEVALTGSDPYFRTGTDLAVLMQTSQPKILQQALMTQIVAQAALHSGVSKVQHNFTGHSVTQWSTKDRNFCSFVGVTENAVVVTNSLTQMMKVLSCSDQKTASLASLDEYRFFRQRYPRGAAGESALIVISDATIRRWCGPVWRIAASRRTRARGTIAEMTMSHADAIMNGSVEGSRQLVLTSSMPDAGELWLSASGVHSTTYGTLNFQTPIAEMDMRLATAGEVKLYESWRRQYERQWRGAFDPIALQLSLGEDSVSADLSVIPLMIQTQYRSWLNWVGNARLKPDAGDRHNESLASLDIALDTNSMWFGFARTFLAQQSVNLDLLSWIDGSATLYLDEDQQWMKRVAEQPPFQLNSDTINREAPIGFFLPSNNNVRMTAFVVAARSLLQQFTPNLIRWDQVEHNGLSYVIATVVENTPVGNAEDMPRAYYVTTPEGLTLSLNEKLIQRAIDRHLARKEMRNQEANEQADEPIAEQPQDIEPTDPAAISPQIGVRISGKGAATLANINYPRGQRHMSRLAWSNVPILNYLRHRYPQRDPFDVYQQLLGEKLSEPGGGRYEWVERFQSYESTLYGHHLAPKAGPSISPSLGPDDTIETTLSFDDGGLRATIELTPAN